MGHSNAEVAEVLERESVAPSSRSSTSSRK